MENIRGKRVPVVEGSDLIDNSIVASIVDAGRQTEDVLPERGAIDVIDQHDVPIALGIGIRLDGMPFTLATRSRDFSVPFIFASGQSAMPRRFLRAVTMCQNAYAAGKLLTALDQIMAIARYRAAQDRNCAENARPRSRDNLH